jgi:hypothetical protein
MVGMAVSLGGGLGRWIGPAQPLSTLSATKTTARSASDQVSLIRENVLIMDKVSQAGYTSKQKTPGLPWPSVECHTYMAQVTGSRLSIKPRTPPVLIYSISLTF